MKQGNIERIERMNYLLEMGIDFQANDLISDIGELKTLPNEFLNEFFRNVGKWVWVGHFDKNTQTIKVKVEKELFC